MGRLEGAGSVEVTCIDRSRDTESALLLSLLPQSRGAVTESVTLNPTVLGWSLTVQGLDEMSALDNVEQVVVLAMQLVQAVTCL